MKQQTFDIFPTPNIQLWEGDCLDLMPDIEDGSVNMVMADPPYGTTACKWDSVIPLELMWEQLKRVIKPNGAIVLTASQPFTTTLISSNMDMFKYEWIWDKVQPTGAFIAKYQPMKLHENILVFYIKQPAYNRQMTIRPTKDLRPNQIETTRNLGKTEYQYLGGVKKLYSAKMVFDFCMGSGTTGIACKNLNRAFIGIEKDTEYFEIAKNRLDI